MSVQAVRQALEVAFNTWATANNVDIAWQNRPYTPAINTMYVRATMLPAETLNPSLGDDHRRYVGILQLLIYAPDGNGSGASEALADTLLTYFKRGESFTISSVLVRILDSPSISGGFNDNGWYVTPVSVRYQSDIY